MRWGTTAAPEARRPASASTSCRWPRATSPADYELLAALRRQAEAAPAAAPELQPLFVDLQRLVPIPNAQGYRSTDILPDPDAVVRLRQRAGEALEDLLAR